MRAEANELQDSGLVFPVDHHQVWLDVAVAMVLPVSHKCMVMVLLGQCLVVGKRPYNVDQLFFQCRLVRTLSLSFVVPLELPVRSIVRIQVSHQCFCVLE